MSAPKRRILITRPQGQEQALVTHLHDAGYDVVHQPLLTIEPVAARSSAQTRLLLALDEFAHVIFVSANAVHYGCDWIEDLWPQYPTGLQWYGPGPASVAALADRGLAAMHPSQRYDSEGLLALPSLQQLTGDKVLLVKGVGGRTLLQQGCEQRGATVAELICYRREPVTFDSAALRQRMDGIDAVVLSSGSASEQLAEWLLAANIATLQGLPLVVPGSNAVQRAQAAGFTQVIQAASATDADILEAINTIWV